jgi:hypothetical protein
MGKIDWKALLERCSQKSTKDDALGRMIASRENVSGLAVSIGVQCDGAMPHRVVEFVQSLAGSGETSGRRGEDEFLLICPQERGAAAQRRLARISRELWDFQLESLGDFRILFSWGGVEVENEPIEDAIEQANMRMRETQRARQTLMTRRIRAASASPVADLS